MIKNRNFIFSILLLFVMLIGLSSINATSENITQDTISYDSSTLKTESNTNDIDYNTHVINTATFNNYIENGLLNDEISSGDTLDIQGKLDDPKFALNINKPVNIISSTGDAYIDLDTHSTDTSGGYTNGIFQVTSGGAGSNITGITFHNTRIYVSNTQNVHIENISVICESNTGFGVGSFSIRDNSDNISVINSYFETFKNGGHSNVVIAGASNSLIENNTIIGNGSEGILGNLLYLTTYGGGSNTNITIRNNTIRSYDADSYATCYGLVLEGSGHIIEGNIIDNAFPVMAQYADAEYGVETRIDGIIFNNNIIVKSQPMLVFPGIVSNNTFYGGATLKQVYAYNNNFNTVTIQNNVVFENNTAKKVIVNGENNTLNNNVIYSDEEYAVTISGENNTLSNNRIISNNSYGEDAINNATEYISINNSETLPRVFNITDANIGDYFDFSIGSYGEYIYTMKDNIFNNGDILVFNITFDDGYGYYIQDTSTNAVELIVENTTSILEFHFKKSLIIKNSFIWTYVMTSGANNKVNLINSTVGYWINNGGSFYKDDDSLFISEHKYFLHNYYVLVSENKYIPVLDKNGYVLDNVESFSIISVCKFNDEFENIYKDWGMSSKSLYCKDIYINKPLNFVAVPKLGIIGSNVHLIEGSTGTTFTGITFENDVIVEVDNIKFINCTFNKNVELKNNLITLEGSTFYGNITLIASNNTLFNSNIVYSEDSISVVNSRNTIFENNTVTTTAGNTIVFDDESSNNIVRNNVLVAASLVGDDSVNGGENTVEDNTPGYDTKIVIDCDSQAYVDDDFEVTITVNDLNNSKPVSKGYVEVYYDGYLIDIKDLTDGTTSVTIPVADYIDDSDGYPIKVWYYDGKRYNNNVTKKSISVVKSNVSIAVDEFNAKLNDKVEVTATFLNERGNPVQDTNVTFTIGRSTYTTETDNGVATINELITSEWIDAGKLIVSFPSTEAYNSNTTTIILNTSKADIHITPSVTVEGSTANINLALTDELNSNVTDGKITITTLDGTQLASGRVSNGVYTATVTIPEDYTSEYLVANFTGSYYYNDLEYDVKLTAMLNSTITVVTNSPVYGEELIITGKLVDSRNNAIKDTNITVNINGVKEVISTGSNGNYTYSVLPVLGVNTITVSFDGNSDVYATSATKNVTIRDTDHDMNDVLNQLDELTAENARLQEQLANQTGELSEQNAALQQQIDTLSTIIGALTDIINSQNEQINSLNEQIAALTAPENTTIIFNDVVDARYKSDVVISGMLTSQKGLALSGQTVTLTVGDKTVDVITKNGEFEYTTVFKSVGEQTVTASYAGSDNYVASDASVTFDVAKQDVVVTVDPIADSAYGDNVTITGKFSDVDGKAISNSNVRVFVNGKKFLAKTDKTGAYSLSAKVTSVGENNVTVGYGGNDKYNAYEDTITFNADKQDVIVTVDAIEDTKVGKNVTITGTFTDKNGKAIINSNVKILINGKKYLAKTDSTGAYTFTTKVTAAGINNITVGYSGNDKYNAYEDATTFNADAQDVIVTVNPVEEVTVGKNVTITGTFTDKYGKAVTNSNVRIILNGKKYYAKTDSTGAYTFTTTVTTEGINNITAGYGGSAKYNACETNTTFVAKAE